ncbi:hypothetical protein Ae717Ps2_7215 [Pseudonocardia sp. Ae717_Ps2]|nr:hypothetical protein Ae717Ps2_7215 [Pseudonocardia sp. Ae717_Ps2]
MASHSGAGPPGSEPVPAGPQRLLAAPGGAQLPTTRTSTTLPHVHFHGVVADRLVVLPATSPARDPLLTAADAWCDVPGPLKSFTGAIVSHPSLTRQSSLPGEITNRQDSLTINCQDSLAMLQEALTAISITDN